MTSLRPTVRAGRDPAPDAIAASLVELVRDTLDWDGPLPRGDLRDALDSMALMTLVVAVEDHFRVCLEPEDERRIVTFDDLVEVIGERLAAGSDGARDA